MKTAKVILSIVLTVLVALPLQARSKQKQDAHEPEIQSQWKGARVAFLGDSITDESQLKSQDIYWHQLVDILGIEPYCYGISGHCMNQIIGQAEELEAEHGQDVDAIVVFVGTNDYNASLPMGEWYNVSSEVVDVFSPMKVARLHREFVTDDDCFKGRINNTIKWLKSHYPTKQIIFLTPIHRGFAKFSEWNIQPDETYSNAQGLFIDDYVEAIKEAGNIWAVPVIDLNSISGLYPNMDEHVRYFRKSATDRLHPNTEGHRRMAYSIAYQLLGYPAKLD